MTSIALDANNRKIIVGVDTHKYVHVAVAIDNLGVKLGDRHVPANREGYARLEAWAASLGRVAAFGIEGTGSYGVGVASFLRRSGHRTVEVNRGDRRSRRNNGKTDTLDAEAAARAVLSGEAVAVPKHADGAAEMIRQIIRPCGHAVAGQIIRGRHQDQTEAADQPALQPGIRQRSGSDGDVETFFDQIDQPV